MRTLTLAAAVVTIVMSGAALAQKSDRITVSPTLPKATAAESSAVDAATSTNLLPGLALFAANGQGVGRVVEVVRTGEGQINRVLVDGPDGKRRSISGSTVKVDRGRATTSLSQAAVMALPEIKP